MATSRFNPEVIRTSDKVLIRTKDLTLAAFLICQGHEPAMVEIESARVKPGHPQGAWEFQVNDDNTIEDQVEEFVEGDALVEPIQYQECLNKTRRDLFEFLGIGRA
jgi:hypothetical protein